MLSYMIVYISFNLHVHIINRICTYIHSYLLSYIY